MDELKDLLNKLLAESFAFYIKAQYYHWNVTGPNFPQYHEFFGNLYDEVQKSIDNTAEHLRALDGTPVGGFQKFMELSSVKHDNSVPTCDVMIEGLHSENEKIIDTLRKIFNIANRLDEQGLANYIGGRLETHKKHAWMLKATMQPREASEAKVYELNVKG